MQTLLLLLMIDNDDDVGDSDDKVMMTMMMMISSHYILAKTWKGVIVETWTKFGYRCFILRIHLGTCSIVISQLTNVM